VKLAQRQVPGQVAGAGSASAASAKANGTWPQIQWISAGEEAKPGRYQVPWDYCVFVTNHGFSPTKT